MKTIRFILLLALLMPAVNGAIAQDVKYMVSTKVHANVKMDNFSKEAWLALEKEYFDKVTSKNELILEYRVLIHYFTEDNTEILVQSTYPSWDAIQKARESNLELEKKAWPDEKVRTAFFDKIDSYYTRQHSDEIYTPLAEAIVPKARFDKDMVVYMRVSYFGEPKDGSRKDFEALRKEVLAATGFKNEFIKAYYSYTHAWGGNNMELTEFSFFDSLADVEKSQKRNSELFKLAYDTDAKRAAFREKYDKYFNGRHSDYFYKLVPELWK